MSDPWQSAKIKQFEHVTVDPTVILLRVTGKASRRRRFGDLRPTLLADDGHVAQRFAALPSPPDERGVLRAAFLVPADVITTGAVFSLECDDGSTISLPAPTPGEARLAHEGHEAFAAGDPAPDSSSETVAGESDEYPQSLPAGAVPAGEADDGERGRRAGERRAEMAAKLTELSAALAESRHAAGELQGAREAAEAAAVQARAEADALARQVAALQRTGGDFEQRLLTAVAKVDAEAEARVAQARATAEQAVAQAQAAAEQHATAAETHIEQRVNEGKAQARAKADARAAEAEAATAPGEVADLKARLRHYEREVESLTGQVEALRHARAHRDSELRDALDSGRMMTTERDEMNRQAEAFDQVATKARQRAAEADAENEQSTARLNELETWRGELERRLTATTSELGAARIELHQDQHELRSLRDQVVDAEARAELACSELNALQARVAAGATTPAADANPMAAEELESLTAELATLRAAQAADRSTADADSRERIRQLEAEREDLAHRAQRLAIALQPAERLAELARGLIDARAEAEGLEAAAGGETGTDGDVNGAAAGETGLEAGRGNGSDRVAVDDPGEVEAISRRAETQAAEQAARELALAAEQARSRP